DNQPAVDIRISQGERPMFIDNKLLGNFKLDGIGAARRGEPQIEVTFDIDANGIVSVSAKDLGTGKSQQITITGGTALDKNEISQMVEDAETHSEDDSARRAAAEARNQADHVAYTTEKTMSEHGDKLSDDERADLQGKLDSLRETLKASDADAETLSAAAKDVMEASQILGQKVYEQAQAETAADGDEGGEGDDDVVEAEIVDDEDGS
ncbi:Hsp70 family protein, partial [bacterium]|nr:Hsp70 family protein [bacterium]